MPSNAKGGKGYKKKKKVSNQEKNELVEIIREPGQMPARAIRLLGNRQVLCYCNDDVLRMCHICGRMKGRQYVNIGDVVLISLRSLSTQVKEKDVKTGDIVNIYDRGHYSSLRKDETVNKRLLLELEKDTKGYSMSAIGKDCSGSTVNLPEDDGIEFVEGSESESEGENAPVEKQIGLDEL